jgi:hypothetical protein
VTAKYIVGHGLALGENSTGAAVADPVAINADFPLVHSDFESGNFSVDNGHGFGLDVGASIEQGDWTVSAAVQNVVNTFEWNADRLSFRPLSFTLEQNQAVVETGAMPLTAAPAGIRSRIGELTFKPVVAAGVAWRYAPDLMFTADAHSSATDGLIVGPTRHIGGGFEYRLTDAIPLRLGGAMISMGENADGWQAGGGFGLDLGNWNVAVSALRRSAGRYGDATLVMVSLFGAGR